MHHYDYIYHRRHFLIFPGGGGPSLVKITILYSYLNDSILFFFYSKIDENDISAK